MNENILRLPRSCFGLLADLLDGVEPAPGLEPIKLSVGDPEHAVPEMVMRLLNAHQSGFGDYAPGRGTRQFRDAVAGYLARRFSLPTSMVDAGRHVVPVCGLKEAMFLMTLTVTPRRGSPLIALGNPFYQQHQGCIVASGAEPLYLRADATCNFLPDLDALGRAPLERVCAFILCSPANPQGSVAGLDYLCELIRLARAHDFVLMVDECYTDIYLDSPPVGVLQACAQLGGSLDNVVTFHSVSKRSNAPGLRSGFAAGDARLLDAFMQLRDIGGVSMPTPVQAVSTALWADDAHADASRELYRPKFEAARRILGNRIPYSDPDGGMFLWLDVGDCVGAAKKLWSEAAVRVMPGKFMSVAEADGVFPGEGHIRVALVPDLETTTTALERIARTLG